MSSELVAVLALAAAFGAAVLFHGLESRAWRAERAQLLDRIMARSYSEYVYATKPEDTTDTPQMTTDQAEAAWYAANERKTLTEVA